MIDHQLRRRRSFYCPIDIPTKTAEPDRMNQNEQQPPAGENPLAKMSIKAGVEGEGKPMKIKSAEPKQQIKGRMQPLTFGKPRPSRAAGDSIF
jgi:hypothetical protein